MEYAVSSPSAREKCAYCRQSVLDRSGEFWVWIRNETGHCGSINLGEEIDRRTFLAQNPEIDRRETFLALMAQMDFEDAEIFLKGEDEGSGGKKMDPNTYYDLGRMTAMHMAALNDDVEGVQLLLRYGADRDFRDEEGKTALDMAREQKSNRVLALLSP